MRKIYLLLMLTSLSCLSASAFGDLDLDPQDSPTNKEDKKPRSIIMPITASIDSNILVILYDELLSSRLVIKEEFHDVPVFDQTYPASSSVQVDLSLLPSGNYYLYIYAYDTWWTGEFEL